MADADVRVLLFAAARDLVGARQLTLPPAEATTAAGALAAVVARHPALADYVTALRVAVNGAYAQPDDPVAPGDEVAIIPPVAGG